MKRYFGYKCTDKEGFTLAEVLITIGVIGVVAAMTIPTLMMNYQRKVWEARLKKSFSITVNACERMLVEENVSASNETELFREVNNANVRKYFKVLRDGESTTHGFLIALPDGADLYFNANNDLPGFNFYVDVNGDSSKPNVAGRDLFEFDLDRNCTYSSANATSDEAKRFKYVAEHNWEIPDDPADYAAAEEAEESPAP
jgi:prepilin-type N-terminal cleavage/methylation domain-containing protein